MDSEHKAAFRKMGIYFCIFLTGFAGMLHYAGGAYRNYVLAEAIAIGGTMGYFLTPAWEQLKHERNAS